MRFRCPSCNAPFDAMGLQFSEITCPNCSRRFGHARTIPEGVLKPLDAITASRAQSNSSINETAANWWADRFEVIGQKKQFKAALLKHLPEGDWETYNDYDPNALLLAAVREVTECRGSMYSGDGLFPRKTGLKREGNRLLAKEGSGASWELVG